MEKKKLGLVPKLIIAIILGILFGQFLPEAKRSLVSAKCPGSCPKDMYRARVC